MKARHRVKLRGGEFLWAGRGGEFSSAGGESEFSSAGGEGESSSEGGEGEFSFGGLRGGDGERRVGSEPPAAFALRFDAL